MTDSPIQQLANHPRRNWIVGGGSIVVVAILGLPAFDDFTATRAERRDIDSQITEVSRSLENLDALTRRVAMTRQELTKQDRTVDASRALDLREQVVRLIQEADCRLIKVQLSDPSTAPWKPGFDPLAPANLDNSDDIAFNLVTTKLNVSAEGSLTHLDKLISQITELHTLAVPTRLDLKRDGTREFLRLEIELSLLDLVPKANNG